MRIASAFGAVRIVLCACAQCSSWQQAEFWHTPMWGVSNKLYIDATPAFFFYGGWRSALLLLLRCHLICYACVGTLYQFVCPRVSLRRRRRPLWFGRFRSVFIATLRCSLRACGGGSVASTRMNQNSHKRNAHPQTDRHEPLSAERDTTTCAGYLNFYTQRRKNRDHCL